VLVAGEPPRMREQLVAVELDEAPERGQSDGRHLSTTARGAPV
jgi:hypothetical protein